ncbi:hypothetical protein JAAARDRAFT_575211 [Jaapia argillacea MUCL 33604]|uniref:Uncharacterized protein n=1 Tax=Jaapia argillacea MUCL 33604 TaxID=933084 RepID=A0A067QCI1_9AGAM|nr:hypothetical protein JAAARDRAFT_575211 [Jaapia argillacea MUCL 33604]
MFKRQDVSFDPPSLKDRICYDMRSCQFWRHLVHERHVPRRIASWALPTDPTHPFTIHSTFLRILFGPTLPITFILSRPSHCFHVFAFAFAFAFTWLYFWIIMHLPVFFTPSSSHSHVHVQPFIHHTDFGTQNDFSSSLSTFVQTPFDWMFSSGWERLHFPGSFAFDTSTSTSTFVHTSNLASFTLPLLTHFVFLGFHFGSSMGMSRL